MFLKRFFDHRVTSLLMIIFLYAGIHIAMGQDSAKIWEDSSTGLMWAVEDNGNDISWSQASVYCQGLTLGGHTDWRLGTIEELEGLYDRNLKKEYKVKGSINLQAANVWSASKNDLGDSWIFNFGYGGTSIASGGGGGCSAVGRALCTRRAGSK
jgi:hypothetical protein